MNQYFKLKKITKYKDIVDGKETTLPFSDLALELEEKGYDWIKQEQEA